MMLDVLRISGALVPHLAGKLWDDLVVRRSADGVPATVDELDARGVADLFRAGGLDIDVPRIEMLDRHAGTTSRARLRLDGVSGRDVDAAPVSVFAKLAPADLPTRLFVNLMGLAANEVRFYQTLREVVAPHLDVPVCFAGRMAGPGGRFVLLLEDLGADPGVDFRQCRPLTPAEAKPAVEALARMQAALWKSPRFERDLAWLKRPGHMPNRGVEKAVSALATKPCLRRFGHLMPEPMQRAVHLVADERDGLEAVWARGAHAFSHGDPHAGNFYFRSGRPGFYDWQVCQVAQGTRDLTYFLVTSVDRDLLKEGEHMLLAAYRDALVAAGVDAAPFESLLEEMRLHVLYVLIAVVVTAASSTMQSQSVVEGAIENVKAALLRHDSLAAWERAR